MTLLADTNILSEMTRRAPNPGVVKFASTVPRLAVSAVSLEEIFYGLTWKPNPRVQAWFENFERHHADIHPVTVEIARRAGILRGGFQAGGDPRSQSDMLIAATAVVHGHTLVTRNTAHFKDCGVPLLNPFSA